MREVLSTTGNETLDRLYDSLPLSAQLYLQIGDNLTREDLTDSQKKMMRQGQIQLLKGMGEQGREKFTDYIVARGQMSPQIAMRDQKR